MNKNNRSKILLIRKRNEIKKLVQISKDFKLNNLIKTVILKNKFLNRNQF